MRYTRAMIILMLAASFVGCADDPAPESTGANLETFSDELVSFPIPAGGTVESAADNSYLVFFGEEMFYLMLRGPEEPEDFGRQRTEASKADAESKQGKTIQDGEGVATIKEISEVSRHEVDKEPVYLFTHSVVAESGGEGGTGYNTVGFGSVDGHSIWFQHTSPNNDDQPASILSFLESVKYKIDEQDDADQPTAAEDLKSE